MSNWLASIVHHTCHSHILEKQRSFYTNVVNLLNQLYKLCIKSKKVNQCWTIFNFKIEATINMNDFEIFLYMLVTNILMVFGSLDPLFEHDLLNGKDKMQGDWETIKILDDGCCSHFQDMQSPKFDICIKRRKHKDHLCI